MSEIIVKLLMILITLLGGVILGLLIIRISKMIINKRTSQSSTNANSGVENQ